MVAAGNLRPLLIDSHRMNLFLLLGPNLLRRQCAFVFLDGNACALNSTRLLLQAMFQPNMLVHYLKTTAYRPHSP